MIYLVTKNNELFDSDVYKIISVQESLSLLDPLEEVGFDIEASGLSCWSDKLLSVQFGCYDFQVVVDCLTIDIKLYKSYLESDRTFLGWNLKFDLQWMYRNDIWPVNVYDGFLAEKLMWLGYPTVLSPELYNEIKCDRYSPIYGSNGNLSHYMLQMSLKKAGEMYLGVELDKSIRGKIIYQGLTSETIVYAAEDTRYLPKIRDAQRVELAKKDLLTAIKYENAFIIPLAYMEYCGIKLDVDKWKAKMKKDKLREETAINNLNQWLLKNMPHSKYISYNLQGSLFDGFSTEPIITLNWNSQAQLLPIFKSLGVIVESGKAGEEKDSLNAKVLGPQKDKTDLIGIYLDYKEAVKVTSTYGQNFIDQINPVSGRIHTHYNQLGTDTTRVSSGGRDKNGNQLVNLLNIPADAETRACFVAEDGNVWISIDYSGQESFIMADQANDKVMIRELTYGEKDLHTLTAKLIFDYIPKDMPAKEVKKKFHKERSQSKGYEFAFNKKFRSLSW